MWILGIEYVICIIIGPRLPKILLVLTDSIFFPPGRAGTLLHSPCSCVRSVTGSWRWNMSRRGIGTFWSPCLYRLPWHPVALRVSTKVWIWFKRFPMPWLPSPLHPFSHYFMPCSLSQASWSLIRVCLNTDLFMFILFGFTQLLDSLVLCTLANLGGFIRYFFRCF